VLCHVWQEITIMLNIHRAAFLVLAGLALAAMLSLKEECNNVLATKKSSSTKSSSFKNHTMIIPKSSSSKSSSANRTTAASLDIQTTNSSGGNGSYPSSLFPLQHNMTTQPTTMTTAGVPLPWVGGQASRSSNSPNNTNSNRSSAVVVIVQLSGGMGNNLCKLAHGIALQHWIAQRLQQQQQQNDHTATNASSGNRSNSSTFPTTTRGNVSLLLRHQDNRKWFAAAQRLQKCFPWTRQFDFKAGHSPHIVSLFSEAKAANKTNTSSVIIMYDDAGINSNNQTMVELAVDNFLVEHQNQNTTATSTTSSSPSYVSSDRFVMYDFMMDQYYDDFRQAFQYDHDNAACCNPQHHPEPDESVFVRLMMSHMHIVLGLISAVCLPTIPTTTKVSQLYSRLVCPLVPFYSFDLCK
jgi:hypothetical protein